jgi:colicin import membrane protein
MKQHLLITCILTTALAGFRFTATAQRTNARSPRSSVTRSSHSSYLYVDDDSSTNPVQTIINYKDSQLYNIRTEGDKIVELYVDNRKIPADSFFVYTPLVRRLEEQIKQDRIQAEKDRIQAQKDEVQARIDQVQAMKDADQARRDAEQAKRDAEQAGADKIQAERDAVQAKKDAEQGRLDAIQAEKDRAVMKSLISELVKENLIPDEKSLSSLMLNEFVFVINGKKQSEELLEKFKAKYITRPGTNISYHNDSR